MGCKKKKFCTEKNCTILGYFTDNFRTFVENILIMNALTQEKARFDTRLSLEQKILFERAALLGGYRNLTDFVVATVQSKAKEIIEENEKVLISEKDKELFFKALMNPKSPNENLKAAKEKYDNLISA